MVHAAAIGAVADGSATLIGRESELATLQALVSGLAAGRGGVALLIGEPGVGKSALLRAATATAEAAGCQLAAGVGDELAGAFPLLPFLDALGVRPGADDQRRADIAGLLRGDAGAGRGGADPVVAATEHLLALVDDLCVETPLVLVIDDLQSADEATVRLWYRLARAAGQVPLLLLGGMRPAPGRDDLAALRRGLVDLPGATVLGLEPLPPAAVRELVSGLAGGPAGAELLRLAGGAGGNPLYLAELVAALRRAGSLAPGPDGLLELTGSAVPGSLAAAIADRLDFLPGPVRELLSTAALLGTEFEVDELRQVTGRSVADLLGPLQQARAAGVLTDAGRALRFRHPLIRTALYEQVPAAVRAAWHEETARTLAAGGASALRVARHLHAALAGQDAVADLSGWPAGWLAEHAEQLVNQAPRVAADLLQAALEHAGPDARPGLLAARLATALLRTGDTAGAERVAARAAARLAADAGGVAGGTTDPDLLVDLLWTRTDCHLVLGSVAEGRPALIGALATPGLGPAHQGRLNTLLARTYGLTDGIAECRRLAELALAQGRAAGDRVATAWALAILAAVTANSASWEDAASLHEQALAMAGADPALSDLRLLVGHNQAVERLVGGRTAEAEVIVREVLAEADRVGNVRRAAMAQATVALICYETGRWDDAVAEAEAMETPPVPSWRVAVAGVDALIAARRGDVEGARERVARGTELAAEVGIRCARDLAVARALLRERDAGPAPALATLVAELAEFGSFDTGSSELTLEVTRLAVRLGALDTARQAVAVGATWAGEHASPRANAVAAHCAALLARDVAGLTAAADRYRRTGMLPALADALIDIAAAHAEQGRPEEAAAVLSDALSRYEAMGAASDVDRVRALFRALGVRRSPRPQRRRPDRGWDALTPAEARVAEFVSDGLSNPQIAGQLYLSRRTVQTHVSHILTKLDLRSRVDIARMVLERSGQAS
ncbi:MAG TPA: AAA family ATPase [Mycobacteriales bacterium]|nr:AAA family ATPase [Mycobacteriales bacterium]